MSTFTVKDIEKYIQDKQQSLTDHGFFGVLARVDSLGGLNCFVPLLTFWVMTFQDILRINEAKVRDPFLKKIARHHRLEDAGHEKWFLHDEKYMSQVVGSVSCQEDGIGWLYGKESQPIRDAVYSIASEIYKIDDELLNIVLLLTLESSGHVFFERVADQAKAVGEDDNLKYFSSHHLEVELAHALFEKEMEKKLHERGVAASTLDNAISMIDRCYVAFSAIFDELELAIKYKEGV